MDNLYIMASFKSLEPNLGSKENDNHKINNLFYKYLLCFKVTKLLVLILGNNEYSYTLTSVWGMYEKQR
jgi:hypothetical protein